MDKKEIHIVFRVLNFLHSKESEIFNLLPIDELILITLASHNGPKGICPGIPIIAKERHISKRYATERLSHLAGIGLISINKVGRKNHYILSFLDSIGEPQITYEQVNHRSPIQDEQVNHSSEIGEPQFHIYNKEEQQKEKSFYMQKSENEKKHDFAESMNQMANEARHIEESEKVKNSPMPEYIKEQFRNVKNININPLKRLEVPDDRDHQAKSLEILRQKLISEGKLTRV